MADKNGKPGLAPSPENGHKVRAPVKVAFGHCIWAAPFVVALFEKLDGFAFTSFKDKHGKECWVTKDDDLRQLRYPGPAERDYSSLSADDVLQLLHEKKADLCAVPGNLVRERADRHLLATIVDSGTGCSLSMEERLHTVLFDLAFANPHARRAFSTAEVACAIRCLYPPGSSPKPLLVAEEGTIAYHYAEEIAAHLGVAKEALIYTRLDTSELAHRTFGEMESKCATKNQKLVGVIAWEPHAAWMRHHDRRLRDVLLQFSVDSGHPLPSFTFDLVGSRDDPVEHDMVARLVKRLWTLVEEQHVFRVINRHHRELLKLYFGLTDDDDLSNGFKRIRFCVYPRGIRWFDAGKPSSGALEAGR